MNIDAKTKDKFYNSSYWRKIRRYKLAVNPACQCPICVEYDLDLEATEVHHIIDIDIDWSKRLNWDNLLSVNKLCHSRITMINNQLRMKKSEVIDYDNVTKRLLSIVLDKR